MPGILFAFLAAIFLSLSTISAMKGLGRVDVFVGTFLSVFVGSIIFLLASILLVDIKTIRAIDPRTFGYFAAAGLAYLFMGRTFKYISIKKVGASRTDPIIGMTPLFAALFAIVILGESITVPLAIGTLLIVTGVYFVTTS